MELLGPALDIRETRENTAKGFFIVSLAKIKNWNEQKDRSPKNDGVQVGNGTYSGVGVIIGCNIKSCFSIQARAQFKRDCVLVTVCFKVKSVQLY